MCQNLIMKPKKKKNKGLKCALVFLGPFPIGNVSTLRILSYCKALAKKNIPIKVLIIAPTKEAAINKMKTGCVDGVEYEYMTNITWSNDNPPIIIKLCYYIFGLIKSIYILRRDKINCLLSYHDELIANCMYMFTCKIMKILFVIDKTEYPSNYFRVNKFHTKLIKFRLKMFDKFIVITKELRKFYTDITNKQNDAIFLLPMTIDIDRYKNILNEDSKLAYIAVVFGTHNRDGLFSSIKAYQKYLLITKKTPYKLLLIGDFEGLCKSHPECNQIVDYIRDNALDNNVIFKGLISIQDIPHMLINAKCLLTTPLKYVSGGFPTKLGEYLLSGVPVIATSAGEISEYLTHNENILLSPVEDYEDIAQKILFVQENNVEAQKIAKAGKRVAERVFNADYYIDDLIPFLKK